MASSLVAQMYSIRDSLQTPADLAASVRKLAEIGYRNVQASGFPIEAKSFRKILDDNGVSCTATHTGWERITEDLPGLIEEQKILGSKLTAIGAMPGEFRNPDGLKVFCEGMEKAGAAMRKEGLSLGYHNHSFEFARVGETGPRLLERLYQLTTPQNVWAELDTYWVQHGGGDPCVWIRKFKGRMPLIHFKDMGILNDKQVFKEIGEGNLNWPGILTACKESGVQYYCVEQDECNGRDPFECLATSLRNLKAMGLN